MLLSNRVWRCSWVNHVITRRVIRLGAPADAPAHTLEKASLSPFVYYNAFADFLQHPQRYSIAMAEPLLINHLEFA